MGCNILNFKALTRLTTNIQLVNEEEFCLQILKALWNEIRFKSLDILRYFSIISLWCGIGISYPVVICICIWPQQSTNNAAAYYLPLGHGHQTVRAPPEKNCHPQIMRRQQELFGGSSRSGLHDWYVFFVKMSKWLTLEWLGTMFAFSIY